MTDLPTPNQKLIEENKSLKQQIQYLENSLAEQNITKKQLMENEEESALFYDSADDGVLFSDMETKQFIAQNEAMIMMLGYSREEAKKMKVVDFDEAESLPRAIKLLHDFTTKGIKFLRDVPVRRKDGTDLVTDISISIVELNDRPCVLGIFRDITHRRDPEYLIRKNEEKYNFILKNTSDCIARYTLNGILLYGSDALKHITGFDAEELEGTSSFEGIHPDDITQVQSALDEAIKMKHKKNKVEYRLKCKDGRYKWVEMSGRVVKNETTEQEEVVAIIRDINDRKIAEEELRQSEKRFRAIANYTPGWEDWVGSDGKLIWVNHKVYALTGYSTEDCKMMVNYPEPIIYKEDRQRIMSSFQSNLQKPVDRNVEFRIQCKDGAVKWVEALWQPVFDNNGVGIGHRGSMRDISERKKFENALRISSVNLSATIRAIPDLRFEVSREGRILSYSSPHFMPSYTEPNAIVGKIIEEAFPRDAAEAIRNAIEQAYEKQWHWGTIYSIPTGKEKKWFELSIVAKGDGSVFDTQFLVLARDITDRIKLGQELVKSEMKYQNIFENVPIGLFRSTPDGRFWESNHSLASLLGYDSPDDLMISITDIGTQVYKSEKSRYEVLYLLKKQQYVNNFETEFKKKDGSIVWVSLNINAVLNEIGNIIFLEGSCKDITDRKKAERELIKAKSELEDRILERTKTLEDMNQTLIEEIKIRQSIEAKWRKYEFITNSSKSLMTLINRQYLYEAVNDEYCKAHGKSREDIIEKSILEIWGESPFYKEIKPNVDRCFEGQIVTNEDWFAFPLLGRRYFSVAYYPYYQAEDKISHVSIITHDITERKISEDAIKKQEQELALHAKELEEANTALRIFFKKHTEDQKKVEEKIQLNVNELVMPYIDKLKTQEMKKQYRTYLELLEVNLQSIVSPFMKNLSSAYQNLTPQEVQIAQMIRQGKSSEEMALILNLSAKTVHTHRNNIRKKLNLRNKGTNLRSYLLALS